MKSYRIYLEKHKNGVYQIWNERGVHFSVAPNATVEKIYENINKMNKLENNTKLIVE